MIEIMGMFMILILGIALGFVLSGFTLKKLSGKIVKNIEQNIIDEDAQKAAIENTFPCENCDIYDNPEECQIQESCTLYELYIKYRDQLERNRT